MSTCSDQIMTYRKTNPLEVIEVGDVIMLDTGTNYVTRASANNLSEYIINSRMIIGICVSSNNYVPPTVLVDGGTSLVRK